MSVGKLKSQIVASIVKQRKYLLSQICVSEFFLCELISEVRNFCDVAGSSLFPSSYLRFSQLCCLHSDQETLFPVFDCCTHHVSGNLLGFFPHTDKKKV